MGHCTHQSAVLQDGTAAHALHDAAGFGKQLPVGHAQDHVAVGVCVVYLFNADAVCLGHLAVHGRPDLGIARHHLLRKSHLQLRAGKCSPCSAIDPGLAVDADAAKRMGAQKAALQLTGAAHGAAGTPHDLAGDDLAAAQGHASPVSLSLMGWPSPANTPAALSTKVMVPTPAEESRTHIPARHCPAVLSHTGGQPGLELLTIADIDHLHRCACGRFQSIVHGIVRLGQGVVHAHHPVAQPQPGLLGGVRGAVRGVQVGKAHNERALRRTS